MLVPALLALEDGTLWPGFGFGAAGQTSGEIVFNTSLTGYQEILTDPSYHGQLVTMTMPHIGNIGTTPEDDESNRVWAAGLIIRQLSPVVSNWRSQQPLPDYLADRGIVAITDVDTRALVRHIRTHGAMRAAISSTTTDPEAVLALARTARDMNGLDLAREVSCKESYHWAEGQDWWRPDSGQLSGDGEQFHVVAYDFGIKRNILRLLAARGCRVTVVPATTSADQVLALNPDGIFLSNGPGDPAACDYAVTAVRQLLGQKPIFGICLGHQILALALGAETYKLKFGHRGGNQPVQITATNEVQISSHNHGFAVNANTLPASVTVSHLNLNDNCCEGLIAPEHKAYSVQYHPESSPGPHDSDELFAKFIELMQAETLERLEIGD
ncbi:glutamine-hydrolyzing carbamoyl-phosphate synthase small subunit [Candidatus Leptofilum sp.]|uniref:glutamine-hydrolyzing carbamoyl-phosphate synthase small subunit n=1 Tax=Candidatus Leptofilum sp. TaxID=3241576 RepID=UPI003B5920F1